MSEHAGGPGLDDEGRLLGPPEAEEVPEPQVELSPEPTPGPDGPPIPPASDGEAIGDQAEAVARVGDDGLTIAEAAEAAGVHPRTIRRHLADARIPGAFKDRAGTWVIPRHALELAGLVETTETIQEPPPAPAAAVVEQAPGVLVPLAAWDRMLEQLGNLHEAGQQLAEARERAARAEERETFLRQQLAEERRRREEVEAWAQPAAATNPLPGRLPAEGTWDAVPEPGRSWDRPATEGLPRRRWWQRRPPER